MPNTPCGNSSISPAIVFSTPCTRAMPSPTETTVPTSATSTSTAKLPIWSRMILEISSAFDVHLLSFATSSVYLASGLARRPKSRPLSTAPTRSTTASTSRSCVVTLPSYTVLPIRATAPPMSAGSTRVSSCTSRPVARASPSFNAATRSAGSSIAVDSSARTTCAVIHQAPLERRGELRQQRQPIAVRQQQQQLRQDRVELPAAREQRLHDGALLARPAPPGSSSARCSVSCPADERAKPRARAAPLSRSTLSFRRDVEQRARVADRRAARRSSRLPQLRRVAIDEPQLIVGGDRAGRSASARRRPRAARHARSRSRRAMRSRMSISRRVCSSSRLRSVAAACAMRARSAATSSAPWRGAPRAPPGSDLSFASISASCAVAAVAHLRRRHQVLTDLRARATRDRSQSASAGNRRARRRERRS